MFPFKTDPIHRSMHRELTRMDVINEANRCLYCYDAPCTRACPVASTSLPSSERSRRTI